MHLLFLAGVLSVKLVLQRASLDLLDSLPISVVVENASAVPQTIRFARPAEYAIDLTSESGSVLWSTPLPVNKAAFPPHDRTFAPGSTVLAVYDWNDLIAGDLSPAAGHYVLRVRLLSEAKIPEERTTVAFAPPLSPASIAELKPDREFTLSGTLDAGRTALSDAHGSAPLAHKLLGPPVNVPLVVRGSVVVRQDGSRVFNVERWALLSGQPASAP